MRWLAIVAIGTALVQTPPLMRLVPPQLELHADSNGFAIGRIQVFNHGGEPLDIRRVITSCKCAAATVQKNPVYPLEVGEILVRVNTREWRDSLGTVELSIESNASPDPKTYTVQVRRHQ